MKREKTSAHACSCREVASTRAESTPLRLERNRVDAALAHAVRDVVQTWERSADVAPRPSPEELCGRRGARPDDRVEVLRARLLRPQKLLSCASSQTPASCRRRGGTYRRGRGAPGTPRCWLGGRRCTPGRDAVSARDRQSTVQFAPFAKT